MVIWNGMTSVSSIRVSSSRDPRKRILANA